MKWILKSQRSNNVQLEHALHKVVSYVKNYTVYSSIEQHQEKFKQSLVDE